jgi:hypothetical protein
MSPAQGSKLHSEGSAGTVSAWPSRQSVGPAVSLRSRGQELALEPRLGQGLGQQQLGALLVAGRVDGVDPDQLLQQRHRPVADLARGLGAYWRSGLLTHGPRLLVVG